MTTTKKLQPKLSMKRSSRKPTSPSGWRLNVVFKESLSLHLVVDTISMSFNTFIRLRGKTYDYKILYSSMNKLFLLPKSDEIHVMLVIGLDPPIRQGQTRYPYLVLQFPREEEMDAELNLDEQTIQEKYDGKLKSVTRSLLSVLLPTSSRSCRDRRWLRRKTLSHRLDRPASSATSRLPMATSTHLRGRFCGYQSNLSTCLIRRFTKLSFHALEAPCFFQDLRLACSHQERHRSHIPVYFKGRV